MNVDDLIVVDMQGAKIEGRKERTSEIAMHTTIYGLRPDIRSVVHAHPPVATGFAAAGKPLNLALLPEVIIGLGCVPLADYGLPGTPALTDGMLPYIPKYDAILMGITGAVCYGKDVTAFSKWKRWNTSPASRWLRVVAGQVLPRLEVDKLFDSRTRYGVEARAGALPGCPVVMRI